jgi:hypothetical protein
MTSHGEFRRYFAERHPPRMQFLRKCYSSRRRIRPHGHSLYQDTFPSTRVNGPPYRQKSLNRSGASSV